MDIFNLENITDIPKELHGELNLYSRRQNIILGLFAMKDDTTLSISEIIVGLFRKHNESVKRNAVMVACYRLCKKGALSTADKKGVYRYEIVAHPVKENK
jgi:hypothetical protein